MLFATTPPAHPFTRRLLDEHGCHPIESKCTLCGCVIIGNVMNGLVDAETRHAQQCPARTAVSGVSVFRKGGSRSC